MADETAKKSQEAANKRNKYEKRGITPKKLQVICLRQVGWSIAQVAQACDISPRTVSEWSDELRGYFSELPAMQAAKDAIQCLIPSAVTVYEQSLKGKSKTLALVAAKDILISNKVIADRKVIEDEREQSTGKLVDEAERILAGVGNTSARSSAAGSDTDDTSRP